VADLENGAPPSDPTSSLPMSIGKESDQLVQGQPAIISSNASSNALSSSQDMEANIPFQQPMVESDLPPATTGENMITVDKNPKGSGTKGLSNSSCFLFNHL
jgi:hypothetical protein